MGESGGCWTGVEAVGAGRRCGGGAESGGRHGEGEEPEPMMHGHEKSDPAIVAVKPANKAKKSTAEASAGKVAAEPGERRAGTKGSEEQPSELRSLACIVCRLLLEQKRQFAVTHPRSEPYA